MHDYDSYIITVSALGELSHAVYTIQVFVVGHNKLILLCFVHWFTRGGGNVIALLYMLCTPRPRNTRLPLHTTAFITFIH
jgi:hypothetical protein